MTTNKRVFNRCLYRFLLAVVCAGLVIVTPSTQPRAQQLAPSTQSSPDRIALHQALLDLTNPWTVMCVAAHPDDEDGTSLIVMRRKYGAHTVSLFSTFGEGGQNAIGPELYEELGAIRARETLAASEIQGSEPFFLGLKDFGFSKSADETFKKWGREEALRRMVLQIRKLRPDVIITNHSVTSNDHGHHQATARLVVEAFDAAADANRFPEQLKAGADAWQVRRLFVRVRGQNQSGQGVGEPIVTIDPNERDPARGTMFAEQALSALQKHATQGPWPKSVAQMAARFTSSSDGRLPLIRYRLAREAGKAAPAGVDGVNRKDTSFGNFLEDLPLPDDVAKELDKLKINNRPLVDFVDDRSKVLDQLLSYGARGAFRFGSDWPNYLRLAALSDRIERATSLAAGLSLTVQTASRVVTPRAKVELKLRLLNEGMQNVDVSTCRSEVPALRPPANRSKTAGGPTSSFTSLGLIKPSSVINRTEIVEIPGPMPINLPLSQHLYEPSALGLELVTTCHVRIGNVPFLRIKEETRLDVAPAIDIANISPSPVVIRRPEVGVSSAGVDILPGTPPKITVELANRLQRSFKGEVAFGFENRSPETRLRVDILPQQTTTLSVTIPNTEENRAAHLRRPELANALWFSLRNAGLHENLIKSSVPVVWLDARVPRNLKVGYIRGFDYSLPNALHALGVDSKELTVAEVKDADLSPYSSLIVDNRVYESQPELIAANQKLLDYAKGGGNLIVFYHKNDEWNPDPRRSRPQLAPYKLVLGSERITDENAPISFLEPEHPLLNTPNKLTAEDFVGWIQERGLYYPKEWDEQFHALLQSNDPGEAPLKGGLLVADYGKGHYIYTSMVWYRQLRAGAPGAYRMLANMISYGQ